MQRFHPWHLQQFWPRLRTWQYRHVLHQVCQEHHGHRMNFPGNWLLEMQGPRNVVLDRLCDDAWHERLLSQQLSYFPVSQEKFWIERQRLSHPHGASVSGGTKTHQCFHGAQLPASARSFGLGIPKPSTSLVGTSGQLLINVPYTSMLRQSIGTATSDQQDVVPYHSAQLQIEWLYAGIPGNYLDGHQGRCLRRDLLYPYLLQKLSRACTAQDCTRNWMMSKLMPQIVGRNWSMQTMGPVKDFLRPNPSESMPWSYCSATMIKRNWHMYVWPAGCKLRYTSRFVLIAPQSGRWQKSTYYMYIYLCVYTNIYTLWLDMSCMYMRFIGSCFCIRILPRLIG